VRIIDWDNIAVERTQDLMQKDLLLKDSTEYERRQYKWKLMKQIDDLKIGDAKTVRMYAFVNAAMENGFHVNIKALSKFSRGDIVRLKSKLFRGKRKC